MFRYQARMDSSNASPDGLILLLFGILGCSGDFKNRESDSAPDSGEWCGDFDEDFSVFWEENGLRLDVVSCPGALFNFGLAETDCASDCWYGEDCVYGDTSGQYFYCHPTSSDDLFLEYGGDPSSLQVGMETVFNDNSFEDKVAYYIESDYSKCWIWGYGIDYYMGLDCEEL